MVRRPTAQRWLVIGVSAAACGALLAWLAFVWGPATSERVAGESPIDLALPLPRDTRVEQPIAGLGAESSESVAALPTAVASLPAGMDGRRWARLQDELRDRPDELRRVIDYMRWADSLRHLQHGQRNGAPTEELAALARLIDEGLDKRLANRELTSAEARRIKSLVLTYSVSDPQHRESRVAEWAAAKPGGAFRQSAPDPRQAKFEQRQAEILAARPAPDVLARQLDALRVEVFSEPRR